MSIWCPVSHDPCGNQRCLEDNICRDAPDDHKEPHPMTAARDSVTPIAVPAERLERLVTSQAALLAACEMMLSTWEGIADEDINTIDLPVVLAMRAAVRQARGEG